MDTKDPRQFFWSDAGPTCDLCDPDAKYGIWRYALLDGVVTPTCWVCHKDQPPFPYTWEGDVVKIRQAHEAVSGVKRKPSTGKSAGTVAYRRFQQILELAELHGLDAVLKKSHVLHISGPSVTVRSFSRAIARTCNLYPPVFVDGDDGRIEIHPSIVDRAFAAFTKGHF